MNNITNIDKYKVFLIFMLITSSLRFTSVGLATLIPALGSFTIFLFSFRRSIKINVIFIFFTFLALLHAFNNQETIKGVFKVSACAAAYLGCFYFSRVYSELIKSYLNKFFFIFFIFLSLETICRIFFGDYFRVTSFNYYFTTVDDLIISGGFYAYKTGSPFFLDSNFTGLFILPFLYLYSVAKAKKIPNFRGRLILFAFTLVVLLTFSRTLWLILVIYFLFFIFYRHITVLKLAVAAPVLLFISLIFIEVLYVFISNDGSFGTKLGIWASLIEKSESQSLSRLLFGYGFDTGKFIYSFKEGVTAHALYPQLVGEVGLLGALLYSLVLVSILSRGKEGVLFFISIMLVGFSLFDPWDPVTFSLIALTNGALLVGSSSKS